VPSHADPARARPDPAQPFIGKTRPPRPLDAGKGELQVWRDAKKVFGASLSDLHQVWDAVSWKICQQRDNPACADSRARGGRRATDPGMHVHLTFDPPENVAAPFINVAASPRRDPARAGRELPCRNGLRLHRGRL
jgi:hypothetical protein